MAITMKVKAFTPQQKRSIAKLLAPEKLMKLLVPRKVRKLMDETGNGATMVQPDPTKQPSEVRADRQQVIPSTTSNMARQVIQAMITLALPRLEWAIDQARIAAEERAAQVQGALQRKCESNWRRFIRASDRTRKLRKEIADQWGKTKLKVLNDLRTQVADLTALCMEKQQVIRNLKGQVKRWETLEPATALEVRATPSVKQLVRNAAAQVNRRLAAEAGGRAVVRKYGKKHMSKLGVKGGVAAGKLRRAQKRANLTMSRSKGAKFHALKGGTGVDD